MKRESQGVLLDVSPLFYEVIDETVDQSPVARDWVRREDDGVAWDDSDVFMVAIGNS